jgi:hypothetical protein
MQWQPSQRTLAVMSRLDSKRCTETRAAQHGDEPATRASRGGETAVRVPGLPRRVAVHVVPRAPAPSMAGTRRLRRLTDWLSAVVAHDGMSERFTAERQRDEELVRRVERRCRP